MTIINPLQMKRLFSKLAFAAAIAGALAACTSQGIENEAPENLPARNAHKVHFTASSIDTKTAFGDPVTDSQGNVSYHTYWTENDREVKISLNYEYSVSAAVNKEDEDADGHVLKSSFDAAFDGIETESPYTFYVVSPATALLWASAERQGVSVFINAEQTPTAASIDENAQILVAKSEAYPELPDNVDVHFSHLTAYGKLTLKNVTVPEGTSVTSVRLISEEQPLSGSWYYKFDDSESEQKEASSSLLIKTDNIDLASDPLWFACAPADMGGKPLKVYVNFSNGKALYRQITLKDGVKFVSGGIYKFSVNMASAETVDNSVETTVTEEVWQLVTSASDLAAGDEVIFADSTSPAYAMTTSGSSSGFSAVAEGSTSGFNLGSDGNIRLNPSSSVMKLTVESRSTSSITLKSGSEYLYIPTSGTRYLQLSSSSRSWTISISGSGAATLYYKGSGFGSSSTYYVRYNSNYFNVSTTSATFAIYKKATVTTTASVDLSASAVLQYDDYGAYLVGQNLLYGSTTDQLSREYDADGTLTFAILAPAEDQVLEFIGIPSGATFGDSFTLTLKYIKSITTEIDRTFQVSVVKENGPVLWLVDGDGNGFIVKR